MTNILANFTGTAGTTIGDYTADSGHTFQANTAIVLSSTNTAYLNSAAGSISSKVLGYTTPSAYDVNLLLAKKSNLGDIAVFIGDYDGARDGYLFQVLINSTSVRARVLEFTAGAITGFVIDYTGTGSSLNWWLEVRSDGLTLKENTTVRGTSTNTKYSRSGKEIFLRPGVAVANTTGFHFDALAVNEYIVPTPPYPTGTYPLSVTATAPDTSTATDTGTLQVVDHLISAIIPEIGETQLASLVVPNSISANIIEPGDIQSSSIIHLSSVSTSIIEPGDTVSSIIQGLSSISAEIAEQGDTSSASIVTVITSAVSANIIEIGGAQIAAVSVVPMATITPSITEDADTLQAAISSLSAITITSNVMQIGDTIAASILAHNNEVLPYFSKSGILDITPKYGVEWI